MLLRILTQVSRFIIGILFIYSGFVKLVDPMGSAFKFQEYFSEGVLNMEFLIPFAVPFAVLLVVAELVLGVMLIMGYLPKFTVWSIFGLTCIFLFLTWYSYTYNKVTDCGCFGDAIKISPKATFYKNVIFMGFIIILIIGLQYIKPLLSSKVASITSFAALLISLGVAFYVLNHLPIIDFRAYAIGTDIADGMEYKDDGEVPPIHDFMIETENDGDKLEEMLAKEKAILVCLYNLDKTEMEGVPAIAEAAKKAAEKGYEVYVLSASYIEDIPAKQKELGLPYTFGFCDETALKTAIRANPGIIVVKKGVITDKYNWTDADDIEL